jgi:hypothetical protein
MDVSAQGKRKMVAVTADITMLLNWFLAQALVFTGITVYLAEGRRISANPACVRTLFSEICRTLQAH